MNSCVWHEKPSTVLLDTAKTDAVNRQSLLFTDPVEVLEGFTPRDVPGLLEAIDRRVDRGYFVAGYLDYECGSAFESIRKQPRAAIHRSERPIAWFGVYEDAAEVSPRSLLEESRPEPASVQIDDVQFSFDRTAYGQQFRKIKHHIREGNVYQINFTGQVRFNHSGRPIDLYQRLRTNQHVPYGAFLNTPYETILCFSPELFFRRQDDQITARPMKGTIRRGRTLAEDYELQERLANDPKSRAENLMIVDLLRNDLSRVSRPDTVQVPALFTTRTYDTVTQMTSTVTAELENDTGYTDIFRALFPCGSVTGAPKVRAMQIIERLEPEPRGIYCGAIGYISPHDEAAFNVAIRTVVLDENRGRMGTGSGIVWDSDADLEYEECTLKTRFLTDTTPPFYLIETIRWDTEYFLLDRHLDRLEASARYFDFPFSREELRETLHLRARDLRTGSTYKVRVSLHRSGTTEISQEAIGPVDDEIWTCRFARRRIDPDNRFRYHKTSRRDTLDECHRAAVEEGCDEVVFLNTRGEVTEGSRSNIFIKREGRYYTPPVSSGLLPGVYRSHLLDSLPNIEETALYPKDLANAEAIYLCNAVRGMRAARLVESATNEPIAP
jgi:para-aminobenzoate synthetase/4-amino-4-deoxychorismate lyase